MSGHSHAKKILHKKQFTDAKRGQIFSKLARAISVAAKESGNPESNTKLRQLLEEAKKFALPKENIERAIKKGTGELDSEKLETFVFEAYGPGGIAIIIEGITDNKNRAFAEVKQILNQNGGKLVGEGAIKWMFERKGCVIVDLKLQNENFKNKGKLELETIEAGAEDIYWEDNFLNIYTKPEELEKTKKSLEEKEIKIDSASLDWVAKEVVDIEENQREVCQKLFDLLLENDAVQDIYSNLKT